MAQTGFTPISIYYSSTASNVPTAGNLVAGELAINTADGRLFYKDSAGVVQVIGTKGGVGSSTNTQVLYNSSGLVVGSANLTFNGTTLTTANDASISGLTVGKGFGGQTQNTAIGASALSNASLTGNFNTGIGYQSMLYMTSGTNNTGVGYNTLAFTTTGGYNSAFGLGALVTNTTGSYNTAVGKDSLSLNTTASNNTAVGYQSMYTNTTGDGQAFGAFALYSQTTGSNNTAIGATVLYANTTGVNNAGMGLAALRFNTTGGQNTALGVDSLRANTTASYNTAVGYQAGYSNTTGIGNVFIGDEAGYSFNTSGTTANTFIGRYAGYYVTTGSKNTIIGGFTGNQGGLDIRTSSNNIVLSDGDGHPSLYSVDTTNCTFTLNAKTGAAYSGILNFATNASINTQMYYVNSSSRLTVVNASAGVYLASGGVAWVAISDERLKENLIPITDALTKIDSLRAVTGNYIADANKQSRAFLIAQDVQAVLPEAVDATNPEELGVSYSETIPLLVAAIKELNAKITALENK